MENDANIIDNEISKSEVEDKKFRMKGIPLKILN